MEQNSYVHLITVGLLGIVAVNLLILDLKVFSPPFENQVANINKLQTSVNNPTISKSTAEYQQPTTDNRQLTTDLSCSNACLLAIQQATISAKLDSSLYQGHPLQMASEGVKSQPVSRETYIPLGTGSTSKSDWTDLTATETLINPASYGNVKEAYFIASLRNPTQNGQVEAQLYNATDKHPVWGSHVVMKGPVSQTISSGKITLDAGNKLYRVQIKSTLQFEAFLDNAKIRIISE